MAGRTSFSASDIGKIRGLLIEFEKAELDDRRPIRTHIRCLGFYMTDFTSDVDGFTAADLDLLLESGRISVRD